MPFLALFEQPRELERWIYFHLTALEGKRSKEIALLSRYASTVLGRLYRNGGPLYTAKYLKVARLCMWKALGGRSDTPPYQPKYGASYTPSSKMVPVSLARTGLPKFILLRHRNMMRPGCTEEHRWIRIYSTLESSL